MDNNQEQAFDTKYPSKDYQKTYFMFTADEIRKLTQLDTIVQMGQIAQAMENTMIQNQCLPRVQPKNSPDIGILYDIPSGKFITYVPKVWCANCGIRRATFDMGGKYFCQSCVTLIQKEAKTQVKAAPKSKKKA